MSFLVLSLPRSRSAWLSHFLSCGDWYCGHEQLRYMRTLDDVKTWLSMPNTGSCETAASPFWRLLRKYAPDCKVVTIRRDVEEVTESLLRAGLDVDYRIVRKRMRELDQKLDQVESRVPGAMSVNFKDLADEDICAKVFEFCLPYKHDSAHWQKLSGQNIQINFPALMRYAHVHAQKLNSLAAQAKQAILMEMLSKPMDLQGMSIAAESFESWAHDCQDLFREHCVAVGEAPNNWRNKNFPRMRALSEAGAMQIMVGRCNGKPFGYLMTIVGPSLEGTNRMAAVNTTFYASPDVPGLGLKLQRAAVAALKGESVGELFLHEGVRGDGERMGAIYKRLGATNIGRMFRLDLAA